MMWKSRRYMKLKVIGTILLLTLLLSTRLVAAEDPPRQIHLSWQNDPSTTMTIMWRSAPGSEGWVEYGKDPESTQTVGSSPYTYRFGRMQICWQIAEITGLEPNTTYHYRLRTSEPWESDGYSFKTAPVKGDQTTPFKFAAFCDVQGGYKTFQKALQMIKEEKVDLLLYLGDFTASSSQPEYDLWFESGKDLFPEIPLMSVRGNVDGAFYLDQFAFPGNERWFSLDYGNVHFVFLSTMTESEVAEQRPWLLEDLRTNDNTWTIAMAHKPAFGSGAQNGPEQYIVDHWVDLFEQYGVDLYLNGHEHSYERTWPLKKGKIDPDGIIYITNSSVGDEFYPAVKTWLTAKAEGVQCYMVFSVQDSEIKGAAKGLDGSVFDEFVISK